MGSDNFCLKWNDFESNISASFKEIRSENEFYDVTLSVDGGNEQVQAHKVILAACSPFFRRILNRNPHANPLIYLKGVDYNSLQSILNFMYHGEVHIAQEDLNAFLRAAQELAVKGLTDGNKKGKESEAKAKSLLAKTLAQPAAAAKSPAKMPPLISSSSGHPVTPTVQAPPPLTGARKRKQDSPMENRKSTSSTSASSPSAKLPLLIKPDLDMIKAAAASAANVDNDIAEDEDELVVDGEAKTEGVEEYGYAQYGDETADDSVNNGAGVDPTMLMGDDVNKDFSEFYTRDSSGVYWCKGCSLKTSSRRDLVRHIDAIHMNTVYDCVHCGRQFKAAYLLKRHCRKIHPDAAMTPNAEFAT